MSTYRRRFSLKSDFYFRLIMLEVKFEHQRIRAKKIKKRVKLFELLLIFCDICGTSQMDYVKYSKKMTDKSQKISYES